MRQFHQSTDIQQILSRNLGHKSLTASQLAWPVDIQFYRPLSIVVVVDLSFVVILYYRQAYPMAQNLQVSVGYIAKIYFSQGANFHKYRHNEYISSAISGILVYISILWFSFLKRKNKHWHVAYKQKINGKGNKCY